MSPQAADPVKPFEPCEPLRDGVTLIEASAGTGKTYTIAALAARHVAEGVELGEILIITFTRLATGDVRDRVRARFVATERALQRHLAGEPLDSTDAVTIELAKADAATVELRRRRLERAISGFDAATISTTHGFCQEMLAELGVLTDLEPDTQVREDISDLVGEIVDDLYIRRFAPREGELLPRAQAASIARAATGEPDLRPDADLEPAEASPDTPPAMRRAFAAAVIRELQTRKTARGVMTFDDLLTRLNHALDGDAGAAARERLRRRFKLVLVDEFQDTDPVQWQILHRAFRADGVRLVLIGDPKQAIYGFRGADVRTYLTAAATAGERRPLEQNFRSDQPLIDALASLFGNAELGEQGIPYRHVVATPDHTMARLNDAPCTNAPLRVRLVDPGDPTVRRIRGGRGVQKDSAWQWVSQDVVRVIAELLAGGATIEGRPVQAGDVAILLRSIRRAEPIRAALAAHGIPAAVVGAESVYVSPAAEDWSYLLAALERPDSSAWVRSAALSSFVGWNAERLARADGPAIETLHAQMYAWARVLRDDGVAALERRLMTEGRLAERVLAEPGGERRLTDLRHLGQLLHRAASAEGLGPSALRAWLAERTREGGDPEGEGTERERRLESDAAAVQLMTIHRSKGLEFPIVLLPSLWDGGRPKLEGSPVTFRGPDQRRKLDVALDGEAYSRHIAQHLKDEAGEDLRLAYVAFTRAKHAVVAWWLPGDKSARAPLTRLLLDRRPDGTVADDRRNDPLAKDISARLSELSAESRALIAAEVVSPVPPLPVRIEQAPPEALATAAFDRTIDLRWRRASYSSITALAHEVQHARVTSEPERNSVQDEPDVPVPAAEGELAAPADLFSAQESPMAGLPVGTGFGTVVHRVLQEADFAAPDLRAELLAVIGRLGGPSAGAGEPERLADGLTAALTTPLGPLTADHPLAGTDAGDRLDELDFELPLAGGETPRSSLQPAALAGLLREHLPADEPLRAYADRLEDPALTGELRGFLTGSIDLVLRVHAEDGPRFHVIDYKTNWLGPPDAPLTLAHYAQAALRDEMLRAHYLLQGLLYSAALHRFLRWRQPGYDPERHLGGMLYLFLRGMAGPGTPREGALPMGVHAWRPPPSLVAAISDMLEAGCP